MDLQVIWDEIDRLGVLLHNSEVKTQKQKCIFLVPFFFFANIVTQICFLLYQLFVSVSFFLNTGISTQPLLLLLILNDAYRICEWSKEITQFGTCLLITQNTKHTWREATVQNSINYLFKKWVQLPTRCTDTRSVYHVLGTLRMLSFEELPGSWCIPIKYKV